MDYCFGVDIGGTTVKIGLFSLLKKKMEEKGLKSSQMSGIGIGIPAPVDEEGIVQNTANLGWGYKEVSREMKELTGMKVAAGNDANVAALGEMWLGAGKGNKNMIMVTLGTGVGGGVIVNGCGCGKQGCLEQYGSATGIARLARKRLAKDDAPSSLRDMEKVDAKAVFDALKEGDQVSEEIVEEFGSYLGHAMANIAVITDPTVIVIGD